MAATFLQYCAMCEKQINHPSPNILYCSQACRRKDDAKPLSASILPTTNMSTSAPVSSRANSPIPSPRSTPSNNPPVLRIPSDLHSHKSDLDPTEWKPKLVHRNTSEAYKYLAQFHAATMNSEHGEYVRSDRPRYGRHKSTVSMSTANTTPSLGNTPTTVSSSFDSVYEFSTRPLLPRHNPMYSLSIGAKSEELVTPFIPPVSIAVSAPEDTGAGKIDWRKKVVVKEAKSGRDGLGALFAGK